MGKIKGSRNENIMREHMLTLSKDGGGEKGNMRKEIRKTTHRHEDERKENKKERKSDVTSDSRIKNHSALKRKKGEKTKNRERRRKDSSKSQGEMKWIFLEISKESGIC